ncbi:hypothetical protein Tco_0205985 [Tanacetum coccineum]
MIGCKVMRTLASVEFEIILIIGLPCCLSSRSVRCLENVVEMSQAYLVETKTPESPHTVASPTPLLDSTPPTRHAEDSVDSDTSASASIAEVAAMSDSAFRKRFRSSYKSSPSSSPRDLPSWKHYWGTSELVEDDDEEEDDEVEDEEIEESLDFDSESEDAKDEGPTIEDEDPAAWDKGLAARDEGPGIRVESLGLGGDEVVLEGQQQVLGFLI